VETGYAPAPSAPPASGGLGLGSLFGSTVQRALKNPGWSLAKALHPFGWMAALAEYAAPKTSLEDLQYQALVDAHAASKNYTPYSWQYYTIAPEDVLGGHPSALSRAVMDEWSAVNALAGAPTPGSVAAPSATSSLSSVVEPTLAMTPQDLAAYREDARAFDRYAASIGEGVGAGPGSDDAGHSDAIGGDPDDPAGPEGMGGEAEGVYAYGGPVFAHGPLSYGHGGLAHPLRRGLGSFWSPYYG